GGAKYSPTTSVTFATSSGSVENLNVPARQGCTPNLRHALATVALPIFRCSASRREDQCVTPYFFGGGVNVAVMIVWSSIRFGRPDRDAWNTPPIASASSLPRDVHSVVGAVRSRSAIREFAAPSAASRMIRARIANPGWIDVERV